MSIGDRVRIRENVNTTLRGKEGRIVAIKKQFAKIEFEEGAEAGPYPLWFKESEFTILEKP